MSEAQLERLLREEPVPGAEEARERGRRLVEAAYASRPAQPRRPLPRLAVALAAGALFASLLLSPAGASVRGWIDDVFATGAPDAKPGLTRIPGGGRLLVSSARGPWVVQPDGSRRLLGDYRGASWSPHGLFVAAASGRSLSAIEPDGTPRWTLSAAARVADPRWSPSGFRIAYRAGRTLRIVAGDGRGDRALDRPVAPLPPAWSPQQLPLLAYVDAGGELRLVQSESGEPLAAANALRGVESIQWSGEGSTLLEAAPTALRVRTVATRKLVAGAELGRARALALPPGRIESAALSPDGRSVAALLTRRRGDAGPPHSVVLLIDPEVGSRRRLFSVSGRLGALTFSPDGERLLLSWPEADQWLFVPTGGRGELRAVGGIAGEFDPGGRSGAPFPLVEGWCCHALPLPPG